MLQDATLPQFLRRARRGRSGLGSGRTGGRNLLLGRHPDWRTWGPGRAALRSCGGAAGCVGRRGLVVMERMPVDVRSARSGMDQRKGWLNQGWLVQSGCPEVSLRQGAGARRRWRRGGVSLAGGRSLRSGAGGARPDEGRALAGALPRSPTGSRYVSVSCLASKLPLTRGRAAPWPILAPRVLRRSPPGRWNVCPGTCPCGGRSGGLLTELHPLGLRLIGRRTLLGHRWGTRSIAHAPPGRTRLAWR